MTDIRRQVAETLKVRLSFYVKNEHILIVDPERYAAMVNHFSAGLPTDTSQDSLNQVADWLDKGRLEQTEIRLSVENGPAGSLVECRVRGINTSDDPGARNTVDASVIEWSDEPCPCGCALCGEVRCPSCHSVASDPSPPDGPEARVDAATGPDATVGSLARDLGQIVASLARERDEACAALAERDAEIEDRIAAVEAALNAAGVEEYGWVRVEAIRTALGSGDGTKWNPPTKTRTSGNRMASGAGNGIPFMHTRDLPPGQGES